MKSEQRTRLANIIARGLNKSRPDNETANAETANTLVSAIAKITGTEYYDEVSLNDVEDAMALIARTIDEANLDRVCALPMPHIDALA